MRIGRSMLAVRPGEQRLVALLSGLFAATEAGRGLGDVAITTLFLNRVGAEPLPWLFIALGLVSLVVALGYGAAIGRLPRRPFVVGLLIVFATILLALRVAISADSIALYGLLWVVVSVINAILLTLIWTVAGTTLDVRQAKRLFPICTSAAIAGSFVGTISSGPLARALGTESLLLLEAALLVIAGGVAARVIGRAGPRSGASPAPADIRAQVRRGYDEVRSSPLLRLIAVAYVLFSILLFSVSFPYQRELHAQFGDDPAELATVVGLVMAGVTGISFLVSLIVANRVYARFGVATAALVLPLVYVAGFGLWLVQFTLTTAILFVVVQLVVQRSLSNAAWSAMFTVVPSDRRPQVLAFIDGVPGQLGTSISGVLLLIATTLFAASQAPIFLMGLVTALALTWTVARIRTRYGEALVRTLRAGLAEQVLEGGPGLGAIVGAPGVLPALLSALDDAAPGTRRLAADLLGRVGGADALARLLDHVADPDAEVRAAVLRSVVALDPTHGVEVAERLAGDPSPAVQAERFVALARRDLPAALPILQALLGATPAERRMGVRAAGRVAHPALEPVLLEALADPERGVGAAAAAALGSLPSSPEADRALVGSLDDEAATVRRAAAHSLAARGTTTGVVEVLHAGSERAQEAAIQALAGSPDAARDAIRSWALPRVDRAVALRRLAAPIAVPAGAEPAGNPPDGETRPALDFLRMLLDRRGRRIEEQLLAAVAALGAPDATGLLRRCLRSPDPDTRAQAIEAIDAIGDRTLGQAIVRLLDSEASAGGLTPEAALRTLADDPDPWLRTLALRAGAEALARQQAELARRAAADPDPAVRTRLDTMQPTGGPLMADTASTLGELDRMLFLRRVPLFARLDPEDLQRLAMTATERLFVSGEALMREGEPGDELMVVVNGRVRVFRLEDGVERALRSYGPGDHIGELAVLRERLRAATVRAETDARVLVIGGEGLRAILTERPEAAMAMLGTLAERISAQ